MSYSQSYDSERGNSSGGGGCMLLLLAAAAFALVMSMGGDSTHTHTTTANGEALSRNQVNLFSDVRNEYYDCIGAGSCIWFDSTNTSSTTTNVDGERNNVSIAPTVFPDGVLRCYDQTAQAWTVEECSRQGVQP